MPGPNLESQRDFSPFHFKVNSHAFPVREPARLPKSPRLRRRSLPVHFPLRPRLRLSCRPAKPRLSLHQYQPCRRERSLHASRPPQLLHHRSRLAPGMRPAAGTRPSPRITRDSDHAQLKARLEEISRMLAGLISGIENRAR